MTVPAALVLAVADEAVAACRAAALAVRATAEHHGAAAASCASWEGPHRATFDAQVAGLERQAAALEAAALRLANHFAAVQSAMAARAGGGGW